MCPFLSVANFHTDRSGGRWGRHARQRLLGVTFAAAPRREIWSEHDLRIAWVRVKQCSSTSSEVESKSEARSEQRWVDQTRNIGLNILSRIWSCISNQLRNRIGSSESSAQLIGCVLASINNTRRRKCHHHSKIDCRCAAASSTMTAQAAQARSKFRKQDFPYDFRFAFGYDTKRCHMSKNSRRRQCQCHPKISATHTQLELLTCFCFKEFFCCVFGCQKRPKTRFTHQKSREKT